MWQRKFLLLLLTYSYKSVALKKCSSGLNKFQKATRMEYPMDFDLGRILSDGKIF